MWTALVLANSWDSSSIEPHSPQVLFLWKHTHTLTRIAIHVATWLAMEYLKMVRKPYSTPVHVHVHVHVANGVGA